MPKLVRGPWTITEERSVYDNAWISVTEYQVQHHKAGEGIYGVVSTKNLALAIVPLFQDGHIVLVGQHRFPHDCYSWEIPEGGGAKGVDPVVSARRELKEETGLEAAQWREFMRLDTSNSIFDETAICYLATDLTEGRAEPEETEILKVKKVHFTEALEMALAGDITDAISVAAILKIQIMVQNGELPVDISRSILDASGG